MHRNAERRAGAHDNLTRKCEIKAREHSTAVHTQVIGRYGHLRSLQPNFLLHPRVSAKETTGDRIYVFSPFSSLLLSVWHCAVAWCSVSADNTNDANVSRDRWLSVQLHEFRVFPQTRLFPRHVGCVCLPAQNPCVQSTMPLSGFSVVYGCPRSVPTRLELRLKEPNMMNPSFGCCCAPSPSSRTPGRDAGRHQSRRLLFLDPSRLLLRG